MSMADPGAYRTFIDAVRDADVREVARLALYGWDLTKDVQCWREFERVHLAQLLKKRGLYVVEYNGWVANVTDHMGYLEAQRDGAKTWRWQCNQDDHDAMKATVTTWRSLPPQGRQEVDESMYIELRACRACGSTLGVERFTPQARASV